MQRTFPRSQKEKRRIRKINERFNRQRIQIRSNLPKDPISSEGKGQLLTKIKRQSTRCSTKIRFKSKNLIFFKNLEFNSRKKIRNN